MHSERTLKMMTLTQIDYQMVFQWLAVRRTVEGHLLWLRRMAVEYLSSAAAGWCHWRWHWLPLHRRNTGERYKYRDEVDLGQSAVSLLLTTAGTSD